MHYTLFLIPFVCTLQTFIQSKMFTIFHCLLFFYFHVLDVKKLSLVLKVDENMIEQCSNCSTLFIIVNNVER